MKAYYERNGIVIYHGDCREILPGLKADCVVTDPPYGIGALWSRGAMVGKNGSSRLWGKGETWDDQPAPREAIDEILRRNVPSLIWGGNYFHLPPSRCWLVWDKVQEFSGADAELAWTNLDAAVRVFRMSRVEANTHGEERKSHPTEKPRALMRWCLGFIEGGTILDPFMGSGTTLVAAKLEGRKAIGIEIEERYCEIAAKRLAQEVFDFK